jgi:hypothetical protein
MSENPLPEGGLLHSVGFRRNFVNEYFLVLFQVNFLPQMSIKIFNLFFDKLPDIAIAGNDFDPFTIIPKYFSWHVLDEGSARNSVIEAMETLPIPG